MQTAEKLYQKGFLSYPRTETDQYDKAFDFQSLLQKQTHDQTWGGFAQRYAITSSHLMCFSSRYDH
jgi:DNA topoisomerase-3